MIIIIINFTVRAVKLMLYRFEYDEYDGWHDIFTLCAS